jgi:hypothetical protein
MIATAGANRGSSTLGKLAAFEFGHPEHNMTNTIGGKKFHRAEETAFFFNARFWGALFGMTLITKVSGSPAEPRCHTKETELRDIRESKAAKNK